MADEASARYPLETGGVLAGYWVGPDELVIKAASEPGKEAVHRRYRFSPDHDHQLAWIAAGYEQTDGVETYLGDWHTHPGAQVAVPSAADSRTARRISEHKEARAPNPVLLILAGDQAGWTTFCWVAQPKLRFGVFPYVQLDRCTVKLFDA